MGWHVPASVREGTVWSAPMLSTTRALPSYCSTSPLHLVPYVFAAYGIRPTLVCRCRFSATALRSAACADPVLRAAFPDEYKPAAPAEDDDDDDDEPASANRSKAEEREPADAVDAKPKDEL